MFGSIANPNPLLAYFNPLLAYLNPLLPQTDLGLLRSREFVERTVRNALSAARLEWIEFAVNGSLTQVTEAGARFAVSGWQVALPAGMPRLAKSNEKSRTGGTRNTCYQI